MNNNFSLIAVDVDGSLANPVMQASVCLWAVALAALLVVVYRREVLRGGALRRQ